MYLPLLYCIEAVVCRLYEMLYPCICNVVISCWKSGAYGYVICRGGTDMCFVPGSGWKHLDLEQYRISGLTLLLLSYPVYFAFLLPFYCLDQKPLNIYLSVCAAFSLSRVTCQYLPLLVGIDILFYRKATIDPLHLWVIKNRLLARLTRQASH